jgi:hypothetical protein
MITYNTTNGTVYNHIGTSERTFAATSTGYTSSAITFVNNAESADGAYGNTIETATYRQEYGSTHDINGFYTITSSSYSSAGTTSEFNNTTTTTTNTISSYYHSESGSTINGYSSSGFGTYGFVYNVTTATTSENDYWLTSKTTNYTTYIITGTLSGGVYSTVYVTSETSISTLTNTTVTYTTWINTTASISNLGSVMVPNIGTVYQCESPFEVIWYLNGDLGDNANGAFTDYCASTTSYVAYQADITSLTIKASLSGVTLEETHVYSSLTVTLGGDAWTSSNYGITYSNTSGDSFTITAYGSGDGDMPCSTTTYQTYYLNNFGVDSSTNVQGGTYTTVLIEPNTDTMTTTQLIQNQSTFERISNNGITTTMGTDIKYIVSQYTITGVASAIDPTKKIIVYTSFNNSTTLYNNLDISSNSIEGAAYGTSQAGQNQSGLANYYWSYGSGQFVNSAMNTVSGDFGNAEGATVTIVTVNFINGVLDTNSSFTVTDEIDNNWQLDGDFSYLWYPFKSIAVLGGNQVAMTFSDLRTAANYQYDTSTSQFSYQWVNDTTHDVSYLAVTAETIARTTITAGTNTRIAISTLASSTGTAQIHANGESIDSSNRYSIQQIGVNTGPNQFGGYGVDTNHLPTIEIFPGIYASTVYSYTMTDGTVSAESETGLTTVEEYFSSIGQVNQITVIEPVPLMVKGLANIGNNTVFSFNTYLQSIPTNYNE